jgi:hypothetical protein
MRELWFWAGAGRPGFLGAFGNGGQGAFWAARARQKQRRIIKRLLARARCGEPRAGGLRGDARAPGGGKGGGPPGGGEQGGKRVAPARARSHGKRRIRGAGSGRAVRRGGPWVRALLREASFWFFSAVRRLTFLVCVLRVEMGRASTLVAALGGGRSVRFAVVILRVAGVSLPVCCVFGGNDGLGDWCGCEAVGLDQDAFLRAVDGGDYGARATAVGREIDFDLYARCGPRKSI